MQLESGQKEERLRKRDVKPLVWCPEMISRGLKRMGALLEKSRIVISVFGAVVRDHTWTV